MLNHSFLDHYSRFDFDFFSPAPKIAPKPGSDTSTSPFPSSMGCFYPGDAHPGRFKTHGAAKKVK